MYEGYRHTERFLSTLSLRRATQVKQTCRAGTSISIHALLAESDAQKNLKCQYLPISIHALLAESDIGFARLIGVNTHFYPRSPCGERP